MKKIENMNSKDRLICMTDANLAKVKFTARNKYIDSTYTKTSIVGSHSFYYQPINSDHRIYLFTTKRYSPSITSFFRTRGIPVTDEQSTFSITLGELYRLKDYRHNHVLQNVLERVSIWANEIIRHEPSEPLKGVPANHMCNDHLSTRHVYRDDDRVA